MTVISRAKRFMRRMLSPKGAAGACRRILKTMFRRRFSTIIPLVVRPTASPKKEWASSRSYNVPPHYCFAQQDATAYFFVARAKHPFGTNYLHQSFVRAKSPLYSISRPTLVVLVGHFPFAFSPRRD
jgi:hypothetical protein